MKLRAMTTFSILRNRLVGLSVYLPTDLPERISKRLMSTTPSPRSVDKSLMDMARATSVWLTHA